MLTPQAFEKQQAQLWEAYRNLHKDAWSLRDPQTGRVKKHVESIFLKNARFVVNESGRQRTIKEKRKNVHAYVVGTPVAMDGKDPENAALVQRLTQRCSRQMVTYNPYKGGSFVSIGEVTDIRDGNEFVIDPNTEGSVQPCAYADLVELRTDGKVTAYWKAPIYKCEACNGDILPAFETNTLQCPLCLKSVIPRISRQEQSNVAQKYADREVEAIRAQGTPCEYKTVSIHKTHNLFVNSITPYHDLAKLFGPAYNHREELIDRVDISWEFKTPHGIVRIWNWRNGPRSLGVGTVHQIQRFSMFVQTPKALEFFLTVFKWPDFSVLQYKASSPIEEPSISVLKI